MNNNNLNEFAEAGLAQAQLQVEVQRKNVEKAGELIRSIAGYNDEEFEAAKERALALTEESIADLTEDQLREVLGDTHVTAIKSIMKLATPERLVEYLKDFIRSIRRHEEFSKGVDSLLETMLQDNQNFKEEMENLAKEFAESALTLRESLVEAMEKSDSEFDKKQSEDYIRAFDDMVSLKFLATMNPKRMTKIIRNADEYQAVKLKALKILSNARLGVDYNHYESALLGYLTNNEKYTELSDTLKRNLTVLICAKLFITIGATKRVDGYKLGIMSFSKNLFTSLLLSEEDAKADNKIPVYEFRCNLDKIIAESGF